MLNKKYAIVLGTAVGITTLAGAAQMMPGASGASRAGSSSASVTVAAACSMSGGGNHTKTINNGQQDTIGISDFTMICNDTSGFAVYAVGFGQDTVGTTVLHSDSVGTSHDIATNTSGPNSYWSMQVSAVSGTYAPSIQNNFDSAHVVPNKYTKIAQFGSVTDASTGSSMNVTYNAYVSTTQPAGTYTGKVKYVLVHPAGSTPSDNLTMQSVDVWKDTMLAGETYKVSDARDNKEYYVAKLDDGNIWMTQNLDLCIGCSGTAKLTSENTDLNSSGSGIYANGYSTDGNGVITWTPNNNTLKGNPATIDNFATGSPENSVSGWTNTPTAAQMAEGGNHWLASNTLYTTREACVSAHGAVACDHGQVGNYYNWTASVASNDSTDQSARYATAGNSICPKGWRLPKGPDGTNGSEFNTLLTKANIANGTDNGAGNTQNVGFKAGGLTKMEGAPYYYGRFGGVGATRFYNLANAGLYWSASTVSGSASFYLSYNGSALYPANQGSRDAGGSVRCLAR